MHAGDQQAELPPQLVCALSEALGFEKLLEDEGVTAALEAALCRLAPDHERQAADIQACIACWPTLNLLSEQSPCTTLELPTKCSGAPLCSRPSSEQEQTCVCSALVVSVTYFSRILRISTM